MKKYSNVNEKDISDKRKFWYIAKLFLPDKVKSVTLLTITYEAITLVPNENIESNEKKVEKFLNDFFSYVVKILETPEYQCKDNLHNRLSSHFPLQAIMKYRNHPNIWHFLQSFSSF